jgi:hypothetical protein
MPRERHTKSRKAPGRHRCALAALVIGLLATLMLDTAVGQQLPFMQPPYLPPQRPTVNRGLFYMSAGVKYRNLQQVSFETRDTQWIRISQIGEPAFGPNHSDIVSYPPIPSGDASQDPKVSGVWLYNDGFIEPTGKIGESQTVLDPTGPGGVSLYSKYLGEGLGKVFDAVPGGGEPGTDIGTFFVSDLKKQADDGATTDPTATRFFSFTKMLDGQTPGMYRFILYHENSATGTQLPPGYLHPLDWGPTPGTPYAIPGYWAETASQGFAAIGSSGAELRSTNKILMPFVEAGLQISNYFDAFLGFGWFDVEEKFGISQPTQVYAARRAYKDTFPFRGESTKTWGSMTEFFSGSQNQAAPAGERPQMIIFPNGWADSYGYVPTRAYFNMLDPRGPVFPAQETIKTSLAMKAYELRGGGRSWLPLLGRGRLGASAGWLFTPIQFNISSSAEYVATAAEATFGVNPGDMLVTHYDDHKDTRCAYGTFLALDLELGGYNYFLKSNAEYNYYFNSVSYGNTVLTTMNVGGFSATFAIGRRF